MTATRQITVHNAQISTATVEVKTLTISGKQVTLAVFRQLREEPLISEDGYLNGVPWGVVNYHPDKCTDDWDGHVHVVWQRGTDLLRSRIEKFFPLINPDPDGMADTFLTACAYETLIGRMDWFGGTPLPDDGHSPYNDYPPVGIGRGFSVQGFPDVTFMARASLAAKAAWDADRRVRRLKKMNCSIDTRTEQEFEEALRNLREEYEQFGMTASDLGDRLPPLADTEMARRGRYADVRKAIGDLPQLFIAA